MTTYGIIGSGNIGGTLAKLISLQGFEVLLANSRGPQSLQDKVAALGEHVHARTVEQAITEADVIIEAIPFGKLPELPSDKLDGKILISAANYYPERDGEIDLGEKTQTEWAAAQLPGAKIAKAFNTIWYKHLAEQGDPNTPMFDRRALPMCADDADAARAAWELIDALGFAPLDLGALERAGGISQPDDLLYNKDLSLTKARALWLEAS